MVSVLPTEHGIRRLGLIVPTRVGGAVKRNRVKRWLRHLFRTRPELFPESSDVVLIARAGAFEAGFEALGQALEDAARAFSPTRSERRT